MYEINECCNKLIKINLITENCQFFYYDPFPSNKNPIFYFASVLLQFQGRTNLNLSANASHAEFCFTAGARSPHINFHGGDRFPPPPPPPPPRLVRHCAIQNFYIYGIGNFPRFPLFTFTVIYSRYYYRILSV